jgi:hypothetical protein
MAFVPVRDTASTAPVHAAYFESPPAEKVMPLAFEERQTSEVEEIDVVPASAPALPPSPAMTVPDLHSDLAPRGRPVWMLATVALVVAALVLSGFALISLLLVSRAPSVAGSTQRAEPASSAPTIATPPPGIVAAAQPPAATSTTDAPVVDFNAEVPNTPTGAKPVGRPLANITPHLTGTVRLAIKPWGHVIVDGVAVGVTPPLKRLALPQGQHKVQIVNPGFMTYLARIEVRKDDAVTVTYEFK